MALNPYQKYQENKIEGSSQGEMIILLYEGCIRFINEALIFIEDKKIQDAHNKIIKAQRIINELMVTLDFDAGGEIAQNLYNLYDFIMNELIRANIKKEPDGLLNSIEVMQELLEAWKIVIKTAQLEAQQQEQQANISINFSS